MTNKKMGRPPKHTKPELLELYRKSLIELTLKQNRPPTMNKIIENMGIKISREWMYQALKDNKA